MNPESIKFGVEFPGIKHTRTQSISLDTIVNTHKILMPSLTPTLPWASVSSRESLSQGLLGEQKGSTGRNPSIAPAEAPSFCDQFPRTPIDLQGCISFFGNCAYLQRFCLLTPIHRHSSGRQKDNRGKWAFLPDVLDGRAMRFPPFRRERLTQDLEDVNEALGMMHPLLLIHQISRHTAQESNKIAHEIPQSVLNKGDETGRSHFNCSPKKNNRTQATSKSKMALWDVRGSRMRWHDVQLRREAPFFSDTKNCLRRFLSHTHTQFHWFSTISPHTGHSLTH